MRTAVWPRRAAPLNLGNDCSEELQKPCIARCEAPPHSKSRIAPEPGSRIAPVAVSLR